MAERSIGMTTGSGDGDVGGYSSSRMTTFFYDTFGHGVLRDAAGTAMFGFSGSGTSNISIGAGQAMVNGYFYESTAAVPLALTGVANGTYGVVIRVNDTASPITVIRSEGTGATNTTIAAYTVRLALVSTVNQVADVILGYITVSGGTWSSATRAMDNRTYAESRTYPLTATAAMLATNASVANGTVTYSTVVTSPTYQNTASDIMLASTVGGVPRISLYAYGVYHVEVMVDWDTNTTGSRIISLGTNTGGAYPAELYSHAVTAASIVNPFYSSRCIQKASFTIQVENQGITYGNNYIELRVAQNSGAARAITASIVRVVKV